MNSKLKMTASWLFVVALTGALACAEQADKPAQKPEEKPAPKADDQKPADRQKAEAAYLKDAKQVTHDFVRAGEAYFSPDGKKIIFQAEEKETGNPFYQIFIMDLEGGRPTRVSPGHGKTTCSFFMPPDSKKVLFSSTHFEGVEASKKKQEAEIERRKEEARTKKRGGYKWDFDPAMDIFEANPDGTGMKRLTDTEGYDAEAAYSPDGKHIVFCSNRDDKDSFELYIMDSDGKNVRKLTNAPKCYNGGPFFSPDGKKVIYRSDRKKKDMLQIHVINVDGTGDKALTDDADWVNWGPYWYKDSRHVIYSGADHTKRPPEFDLWWMDTETGKKVQISFAERADVLPVFSPDGKKLIWTSARGGQANLWIADFTPPKEEELK